MPPIIQPDHGASGQLTLNGVNAQQIINARKNRSGVKITNLSTVDIFIGFNSSVTPQTGDLLLGAKGAWIYVETDSALWAVAIAPNLNASLSFLELL